MSDITWIKLKTEMFSDDKIRLIESMPEADAIIIIWLKLLVQAGKTNANGYIFLSQNIPFTDEMLSTLFNRPLSIVRLALKTLSEFGMIALDENGVILIENWEKHQNVEGMEKVREQWRLRKQKQREQLKLLNSGDNQDNDDVTGQSRDVTLQNKNKKENKINNIEQQTLQEFEEFWNLYDKKRDRKKCIKKWNKLDNSDKSKIFETLPDYIRSTPDKQFRKDPSTYLNNECWNDEIIARGSDEAESSSSNGMLI